MMRSRLSLYARVNFASQGELDDLLKFAVDLRADEDEKYNMIKQISSFFVAEEHNILTLESIDSGYINETDIQIFYYDKMFEDLLTNGNSYKDLINSNYFITIISIDKVIVSYNHCT